MSTDWADGPLHAALVRALPMFTRDPFSATPRINVTLLHKALKKSDDKPFSYEAVYRWLRINRIKPRNVPIIVELAHTPENLALLKHLGRKPPKVEDFSPFVFA